jgi:hypothetical protein
MVGPLWASIYGIPTFVTFIVKNFCYFLSLKKDGGYVINRSGMIPV